MMQQMEKRWGWGKGEWGEASFSMTIQGALLTTARSFFSRPHINYKGHVLFDRQ